MDWLKNVKELESGDKKMGFVGDSLQIVCVERERDGNDDGDESLYTHASAFGVFFITCKRPAFSLLLFLNCSALFNLSLSLSQPLSSVWVLLY